MTDPQIVPGLHGRDRWLDSLLRSGAWAKIGFGGQAVAPLLAAHANEHGTAWPSIRRLALISGHGRRVVTDGLTALHKEGWLGSEGLYRRAQLYRLRFPDDWYDTDTRSGTREVPVGETSGITEIPVTGTVGVPVKRLVSESDQSLVSQGDQSTDDWYQSEALTNGWMDGIHPNTTPDGAPESDSESGLRSIRDLLAGHGVNGQAADELAASLLEAGPADIARQVVDELAGESSKGENPSALLIWKIRDAGRATVQRLANHRQARKMERTDSARSAQTYEEQHASESVDQLALARQHLASQPAEAIQAAWLEIIQVTRGFSGEQADDLEAIGDPLTDDQAVLAIAKKIQPSSHPEERTDEE